MQKEGSAAADPSFFFDILADSVYQLGHLLFFPQ
jgi:hypothetical protein